MESLDNYLYKKRRRVTLEDFFGNKLSESIVTRFEEDPSWDFIGETLKQIKEIPQEEYDACHGIFFHISKDRNNAYSILKNGLRSKLEKIFLSAFDFNKVNYKQELLDIARHLNAKDGVILKVNMNKHDGKIYKDTAMFGRDDCYYVFDFIPASNISFFKNVKELEKSK